MIQIDEARCVHCGACAGICEFHHIAMTPQGPAMTEEDCCGCGHCLAICPTGAVSLPQYSGGQVTEYDEKTFTVQPENLLNLIRFRRSCRRFRREDLPRETVERLLQAGRYSPTACNNQDVRYVVVHEERAKVLPMLWEGLLAHAQNTDDQDLLEICRQHDADGGDTLSYGCSDLVFILSPRQLNGGIAACAIELLANAMGLGALYLGYGEKAVAAWPPLQTYLGMGNGDQLCAILCLGYPEVQWRRTVPRKDLNALWR